MKYSILLIFLLIFTLSHSNLINFSKIMKRTVTFDSDSFENSLSEECKTELDNSEYSICIYEIELDNYKNMCEENVKRKCRDVYENPFKYFPICKNNINFYENYQPVLMKSIIQDKKLICTTDEKGKICPLSLYRLRQNGDKIEAIFDNCKSKKCTESVINVFKDIDIEQYITYENLSITTGSFSYHELNSMNNLISILESDKCTSLHDTSSTINIKINNILLISSLLLLIFIFY